MGIATFAGYFTLNNALSECGNKNLLNALMCGSTHTGVLGVSGFISIKIIIHSKNS